MASGRDHDKATRLWSLPFGLILGLLLNPANGLIGGFAFAIGGLWLSPDLDTQSRALKRWGILKTLWWPYRKLIPHRSVFSHGPLIGTALRLAYLMVWCSLMLLILQPLGLPTPLNMAQTLIALLKREPQAAWALLLGLEASVWLHLIQDGDPLPVEWQRWRHR
ncbi:MAG: metal-binding protein [Prochlorococcus sp.]|nr:metal-binding protein [Prochlorococcaceae cyanobacterium ETNP18_MAG_1]